MFSCSKVQRSRFNVSRSDRQAQSSLVKPGKAKNFYLEVPFFKTRPYSTRMKSRCQCIFRAADAPEMSFRPNEQPALCHCRGAATQFVQWISAKHFEFVSGFNHDQFAGRGDDEKPPVHPFLGPKIIAANAFLIAGFAGGRTQARYDSSVAPKPDKLTHRN